MENKVDNQILVTGLPGSGKTSFIAALFHYLQSKEITGKLFSQARPSPDAEYLTDIHNKWLECKEQDRTSQNTSKNSKVQMFLKDEVTSNEYELNIPDVAGENFQVQFEDRIWEDSYKKEVQKSSAMVLFIHPNKIKVHALIDDVMPELTEFMEEEGDKDNSSEEINAPDVTEISDAGEEAEQEEKLEPFDIKNCPTQVVLVDILQFHLELINRSGNLPLILVVSAWDMVTALDKKITPSKWLHKQLPLLDQFLIANSDVINHAVFGVSAQGGDLTKPEVVQRLQQLDEQADKVIVQFEDKSNTDISLPLQWIMDQWNK
jgi:hypothetical protein